MALIEIDGLPFLNMVIFHGYDKLVPNKSLARMKKYEDLVATDLLGYK